MDTFLLELYDKPSIENINIDSIVDIGNKSLLYNTIYKDPVIQRSLCFSWVWQQLFGIRPSLIDNNSFSGPSDFDAIFKHIEAATILRYVGKMYEQAVPKFKIGFSMYRNSIDNSPGFVKDELTKKLLDRFCLSFEDFDDEFLKKSLFNQYKAIISRWDGGDDIRGFYARERKHLSTINPYMCTRSKTLEVLDLDRYQVLNRYDVLRTVLTHDLYFARCCLAKSLLVCTRDITELQSSALLESLQEGGKTVVITTQPAAFANLPSNPIVLAIKDYKELFCIPSIFQRAVCWGPLVVFKCWTINKSETSYFGAAASNPQQKCVRLLDSKQGDASGFVVPSSPDVSFLGSKEGIKHLVGVYSRTLKPENDESVGADSYAHVLQRLVEIALAKDLDPAKLETSTFARNCVLLVDNRKNIMSVLSACLAFSNLVPKAWNLCVITSTKALPYYKSMFLNSDIEYIVHPLLDSEQFDIEDYNKLMKDPSTWDKLKDYENCLTIQDDGFVLKPGVEDAFVGKYDYVGAPWADAEFNVELKKVGNPMMVGNGGLSLRSIAMMRTITRQENDNPTDLFNNDLQPTPEDVFFAHNVYKRQGRIPTREKATMFSSEQMVNPNTIGIHKPWVYMPYRLAKQMLPQAPA